MIFQVSFFRFIFDAMCVCIGMECVDVVFEVVEASGGEGMNVEYAQRSPAGYIKNSNLIAIISIPVH